MAKIDKNANLYDRDGNLIRKAPLKDVTIEELEKIIDSYEGDKNSPEYTNLIYSLTDLYRKYGNPHEQELINSLIKKNDVSTEDDERGISQDDAEIPSQDTEDKTVEPNDVPSYDVSSDNAEYVTYEEVA